MNDCYLTATNLYQLTSKHNFDNLEGKQQNQFSLLPKIINGGIAGMIGVACVFPLDLVKTRLQSQKIGPSGEKMYQSILDCFKKTYKAEGFRGMYSGSLVNIILISPEKAIKLAGNDFFRYHFTDENGNLSIGRQMLAGGLAGIFPVIVSTPMELLKIRRQNAGQEVAEAKKLGKIIKPINTSEIISNLFKEKGVLGLYKGISATVAREIAFCVIYFPLFSTLHSAGPTDPQTGSIPFYWSFFSGLMSGTVAAFSVTPFDVIKTRMQAGGEYSSLPQTAKVTLMREGSLAFFKGGACRIMVIAPLFGIAQTIYYIGLAESIIEFIYSSS